jgi:hypothetical protein
MELLKPANVSTLSSSLFHHEAPTPATAPPRPGRVWTCGFDYVSLAQDLFPEYNYSGRLTNTSTDTDNDVVLNGMYGLPCGVLEEDLYDDTYYNGKVLMVNGEPDHPNRKMSMTQRGQPSPPPPKVYQMSGNLAKDVSFPVAADSHLIRVNYGVVFFHMINTKNPEQWDRIFDPAKRPQWNGEEHKLLYVQTHCLPHRHDAVRMMSHFLAVDSGAKCTVSKANPIKMPRWWTHNWEFYGNYKYCLCMENTKHPGYISEKIFMGFQAGCLPIYYGTKEVFEVFNADSFVYWDPGNPDTGLEKIMYLEKNRTAYDEMMMAPILKDGVETINEYFSLSDTLGDGSLKREIRTMMGLPNNN